MVKKLGGERTKERMKMDDFQELNEGMIIYERVTRY